MNPMIHFGTESAIFYTCTFYLLISNPFCPNQDSMQARYVLSLISIVYCNVGERWDMIRLIWNSGKFVKVFVGQIKSAK
jgi:hypothetical protein